MATDQSSGYNELLRQISTSLNNARNTYGADSRQYHAILEILKDCLWKIDKEKEQMASTVDPDMLSVAMGFLEVKGE